MLVGFKTSGPHVSGNQYDLADDYISDQKVTDRPRALLPFFKHGGMWTQNCTNLTGFFLSSKNNLLQTPEMILLFNI